MVGGVPRNCGPYSGGGSMSETAALASGRAAAGDEAVTARSARAPRILVISGNFPPIHGGSAVVYDNLCRYSEGRAIALSCYRDYATGREIEGWREADARAGYVMHRIELLRPREHRRGHRFLSALSTFYVDLPVMFRVLMTVRRIVRSERIEVVCIGDLVYGGWLSVPLKHLLGCKVVIYVHGEEITTRSSGGLFDRLRPYFLAKADAIVAVSRFTRSALTGLMKVEEGRIALIPNGVDHDRFFPSSADGIRTRLGLQGKRVILSVGRLVERKGFDRVIDAMAAVVRSHPDVVCLIAGTGPMRNALAMLVSEWRLDGAVRFLGAVSDSDLRELYSLADVFVLPNREMSDGDTEGFGLVFLEANACGTPVVSGRAGGALDAVEDGVNGLNVDGASSEEIAAAIRRLLDDRDLHARLRAGGLRASAAASWRSRTRSFLDLCDRVTAS